ncbi:type II toxin-antitoxin system death-on-curing family toxin [Sphingomonas sp. S2-65]|uniref:type II toxin-antitoxin system death-on-curing family toxin n=1 Tax=Sphingomonas sp. S2-65 TaxID=2903960 RepID=UPI001F00F8CA|nr:type II toxin-antitoxin system death-on-curing family toxin [Sphingomonas sp. S2-65]UYY59748.1 type II toxin-antitoxin system death-on-curing family toxin [Sphingomonas sp. S2-65]
MSQEPVWLLPPELVALNKGIVERTGEPHMIAIPGALEAACGRPINAHAYGEDDIIVLACMTLLAIAEAHAFIQGNKRVALIGMELFLRNNGYTFDAPDVRTMSQAVYDAVNGELSLDDLVDLFDPFIIDHDGGELPAGLIHSMPAKIVDHEDRYRAAYKVMTNFGSRDITDMIVPRPTIEFFGKPKSNRDDQGG